MARIALTRSRGLVPGAVRVGGEEWDIKRGVGLVDAVDGRSGKVDWRQLESIPIHWCGIAMEVNLWPRLVLVLDVPVDFRRIHRIVFIFHAILFQAS
jgi:hypothetical protein